MRFERDHIGRGCILGHVFRQALDAIILVGRIDIRTGGRLTGLQRAGKPDNACVGIIELPLGIAIEYREIFDEGSVDIVNLAILQPDATGLRTVGNVARAQGPGV